MTGHSPMTALVKTRCSIRHCSSGLRWNHYRSRLEYCFKAQLQLQTFVKKIRNIHNAQLADNAFLFKMHTLCICKYFWRLSLCRIFQTDVKRGDVLSCKEFGKYTDVFFYICFMCIICLWSSDDTTIRKVYKTFFATISLWCVFYQGTDAIRGYIQNNCHD